MFGRSVYFHEYLTHHGLIDDLYKSMLDPDPCAPVIAVLDILKKTKNIPEELKEKKSEVKSNECRNEGNQAYKRNRCQNALVLYNKALLLAPKNSRAMKLAYSNRSALLHKMKAFAACLNDIDTCFSLGCPIDIEEKLKKRKEEARGLLWMEGLAESCKFTVFSEEFFQLKVKLNPQIPCASANVGVIMESQVPKIVAANDVKVGTVLAVETAFVSQTDKQNTAFSCYYCHKMSLNLKPCDGCCLALFCNDNCKENCMKEYHRVECQIIELLEAAFPAGSQSKLSLKAFLKMKSMSKSWKDIITASYTTGVDRIKSSSINEIFDLNNKFSVLNVTDELHFFYGPLYNSSFNIATAIYALDTICNIFPSPLEEKSEAIKATARILMCLSLYSKPVKIMLNMSVTKQEKMELHNVSNFGYFSFIGKLKNSCVPNTLVVGLNKKLALVALQPIERGTELTTAYLGQWLDSQTDKETRNKNMFILYGVVCNCVICTDEYVLRKYTLTEAQKKSYVKLNLEEMSERITPRTVPKMYSKLCKTLAVLSDVPFSDEYTQVYRLFRRCILYLQDNYSENVILDYV